MTELTERGIAWQVLSLVLMAALAITLAVMAYSHKPAPPVNQPSQFFER